MLASPLWVTVASLHLTPTSPIAIQAHLFEAPTPRTLTIITCPTIPVSPILGPLLQGQGAILLPIISDLGPLDPPVAEATIILGLPYNPTYFLTNFLAIIVILYTFYIITALFNARVLCFALAW